MIQNVLRAIGDIETYGVVSICLFFLVFLAALIFTFMQKKSFCQTMSALPLDDDSSVSQEVTYEK